MLHSSLNAFPNGASLTTFIITFIGNFPIQIFYLWIQIW